MTLIPRSLLRFVVGLAGAALVAAGLSACATDDGSAGGPHIVVTFPVLGAIVEELVGPEIDVEVLMPDNVDPHDWSPSARAIEAVGRADLVVANGLALEEGLAGALDEAERAGTPVFHATDHIDVRALGLGGDDDHHDDDHDEGDEHDDDDHHDGGDPHFWVDPLSVREVVLALDRFISEQTSLDLQDRAERLARRLAALDTSISERVATIPEERRKLVTGHESLGYLADRYGFELIGTVIPSSTSQAEASAAQMATLATVIREEGVDVVFTEIGTPRSVVDAIGREAGARVVELPSHSLPDDGSYFTFVDDLVDRIVSALAG